MQSGFLTSEWLAFAIPFLELFPKYVCVRPNGEQFDCTQDDFCDNPSIKHYVNWNDRASIHNWVEDLDLTCTSRFKIGLIGSALFAGWAISAAFLPRLADVYGRKPVYGWSMIVHCLVYAAIVLSRSLTLTTSLMFFLGVATAVRASVGFLYMTELAPKAQQTAVGTILLVIVSVQGVLVTVYFYFVNQWIWL